jgi:CheY-like chemotaxis protein
VTSKHVLIVDDETSVRRLLGSVFADEGYLISEAGDGFQALACLRNARPDVIVLDLMMPGMSGKAFVEEIHRLDGFGDLPIIAVTAMYDVASMAAELHSLGVNVCLPKPFDLEELLSLVAQLA